MDSHFWLQAKIPKINNDQPPVKCVCNCEVGMDGLLCKPGTQVLLTPPLESLSYALQGIHGHARIQAD
jgi:hypothetical protein